MEIVADMIFKMLNYDYSDKGAFVELADSAIMLYFEDEGMSYHLLREAIFNFAWFYNGIISDTVTSLTVQLKDVHFRDKLVTVIMRLDRDAIKLYPAYEEKIIPFIGRITQDFKE